jgi:hypothetical protein
MAGLLLLGLLSGTAALAPTTAMQPLLPLTASAAPSNATGLLNVKVDFAAKGDGVADDYLALQSAIDHARMSRNGLFFPPGNYRVTKPLMFGHWNGILVKGGEPGDDGIAGATSTVRIDAQLAAPASACHEFSGAGYGTVEGISFQGTNCRVMVLNARTSNCSRPLPGADCTIYGSDLVYSHCNFGYAPVAAFANHMGEVLTWRDCRFHSGGGSPGLLISWRLQMPPYNLRPPSGAGLTTGVTLTVFRIDGGEFTNDNSVGICLDMENATSGSPKAGGSTVLVSGTYFASAGGHMTAIQVRGRWSNVHVVADRFEDIPGDPNSPPTAGPRQFLELAGVDAELTSFSLNTFGDCCTSGLGTAAVAGTGVLDGGSVNTDTHVLLGAGSAVNSVAFLFSGKIHHHKSAGKSSGVSLHVAGNLVGSSVMYSGDLDLQVDGRLDIDDNRGGRLVHRSAAIEFRSQGVHAGAGGNLTLGAEGGSGLVQAVFAGTSLLLQCIAYGELFTCSEWGAPMAIPLAPGNITWHCHALEATCTVAASLTRAPLGNSSQVLEVRRLMGTGSS